MPPRSRPWVLPVGCAVLGVVWVLWLAEGGRGAEERAREPVAPTQARSAPPKHDATPQRAAPPPQQRDVTPPSGAVVAAPSEGRVAGISPAVTATATPAQPAVEPPLQLAFQAPTSASVGEAFDVRVALTSHQPVGRIAMEIVYDASLLKARSAEEIDYTQRAPGEVAFSIERSSDGQVGVALVAGGGVAGEGVPATAAVVQFEALAAGGAQIQLSGIAVSDTTDRPMPFEAKGQESLILVH